MILAVLVNNFSTAMTTKIVHGNLSTIQLFHLLEFTTESTKTPIGASEVEEGSISVWTSMCRSIIINFLPSSFLSNYPIPFLTGAFTL